MINIFQFHKKKDKNRHLITRLIGIEDMYETLLIGE